MKTPKSKGSSSYPLADQIPLYTSYGWRKLRIGEKVKDTDYYTAFNNPVDFLEQDPGKPLGIPMCGLLPCAEWPEKIFTGEQANYVVILRPWFPNRNPLLKTKRL